MDYCEKVYGAMLGVALGDGMGAPVEGFSPSKIDAILPQHNFEQFLPVTHEGDPFAWKG